MDNTIFCSNCGNECGKTFPYCPQCGMGHLADADYAYEERPQTHCTSCGTRLGARNAYCPQCGQACSEYSMAVSGNIGIPDFRQIKDTLAEGKKNTSKILDGIPQKGIFDFKWMKDSTIWTSSCIYAVVAVLIGLLLSFCVKYGARISMERALADMVEGKEMASALSEAFFRNIETVSIWLFSFLGGYSLRINGEVDWKLPWMSMDVKMNVHTGFILMTVIPLLALILAQLVRNRYIGKKDGKEGRTYLAGTLAGAVMFALINWLLTFVETGLDEAVNDFVELASSAFGGDINIVVASNVNRWNTFFFSFLLALVVGLPEWKKLKDLLGQREGVCTDSLGISVKLFKKFIIVSGLIAFFFATSSLVIAMHKGKDFEGRFPNVPIGLERRLNWTGVIDNPPVEMIMVMIAAWNVNIVMWCLTFLTGGTFGAHTFGNGTVGVVKSPLITDANMGKEGIRIGAFAGYSGKLILLLAVGLLLAVYIFHKYIKKDEKLLLRGFLSVGFASLMMWVGSAMASVLYNMKGSIYIDMDKEVALTILKMGTYQFGNCAKVLLVLSVAFGLVLFAQKNAALKKLLDGFVRLPEFLLNMLAAAAAIIISIDCMNWLFTRVSLW